MGDEEEGMWLFAYGSLLWKRPPHYTKRIPGYIEGYVRRFWQASQDHRGTPTSPGRVVTLIERSFWSTLSDPHPTPPRLTLGVAYFIPAIHIAAVRNYLDLREINGYTVHHTPFTPLSPAGPAVPKCLVYIGTPSNPQFVGPQDPEQLAELIYSSRGPSGNNSEYLYMMDMGLLELEAGRGEGEGDEHVRDLAKRVRAIEAKEGGPREGKGEGMTRFRSKESTDEVEEVEKEHLS